MSDKPTDLDATRDAELADMEAAVARGGPLPNWAEVLIARAMREGFAARPDDDDGPMAA